MAPNSPAKMLARSVVPSFVQRIISSDRRPVGLQALSLATAKQRLWCVVFVDQLPAKAEARRSALPESAGEADGGGARHGGTHRSQ
jgi:hypothetical protein